MTSETSWPQIIQSIETVEQSNRVYYTSADSPTRFLTPADATNVYFSYPAPVASEIFLPVPTTIDQEISYLFGGAITTSVFQVQYPTWTADTVYVPDTIILDANNHLQQATTNGTSGTAAPTWSTTAGDTTTDGTVTWTMLANPIIGAPTDIPNTNGPTIVKFICKYIGSSTELPIWWLN